ncbi:hypothetical protein [Sphingomonas crocodyli]|uniref:Uncharacterized protein n=1 Tax=Sphingomonas crocodyli TaxID=1979270 RepID=A0A437M7Q1_9SPHN|nr:hypothetical protein [Sphingomonas crocodyli]RVT93565.1 hypothetical protein EOD43_06770 [Sphingomonas crocodyli]
MNGLFQVAFLPPREKRLRLSVLKDGAPERRLSGRLRLPPTLPPDGEKPGTNSLELNGIRFTPQPAAAQQIESHANRQPRRFSEKRLWIGQKRLISAIIRRKNRNVVGTLERRDPSTSPIIT